jgi:hypothetical protein
MLKNSYALQFNFDHSDLDFASGNGDGGDGGDGDNIDEGDDDESGDESDDGDDDDDDEDQEVVDIVAALETSAVDNSNDRGQFRTPVSDRSNNNKNNNNNNNNMGAAASLSETSLSPPSTALTPSAPPPLTSSSSAVRSKEASTSATRARTSMTPNPSVGGQVPPLLSASPLVLSVSAPADLGLMQSTGGDVSAAPSTRHSPASSVSLDKMKKTTAPSGPTSSPLSATKTLDGDALERERSSYASYKHLRRRESNAKSSLDFGVTRDSQMKIKQEEFESDQVRPFSLLFFFSFDRFFLLSLALAFLNPLSLHTLQSGKTAMRVVHTSEFDLSAFALFHLFFVDWAPCR